MKKLINVILVIVLLFSVGFNLYFYQKIQSLSKLENGLNEEINNLGIELEESKELLKSKDIEITELKTQISSKEEEIKGITETIENLESEKEEITKQLGELKEAQKQEPTTKDNNGKTNTNNGQENNGQANNGEQSSTKGGQGNSQTSGAPGGDANIPYEPSWGMSLEDAAAAWGVEYYGSGFDTSGFNHGDGGYGVIHE